MSTVEEPTRLLQGYIGPNDVVKVVVPVVRQGILDWLANDERAFAHAQAVAGEAASELPGEAVAAVAGEADLELAIRDALATFAADEAIICVHAEADRDAVESLAVADAPTRRSIDGVPIRVVVQDS